MKLRPALFTLNRSTVTPMKNKLNVLILSLATCGLASFAQDNLPNPPSPAPTPPEVAPAPAAPTAPVPDAPVPATPAPATPAPATPAPVTPTPDAPAAPTPAAPAVPAAPAPELAAAPVAPANPAPIAAAAPEAAAPSPNEVVPLIVIEEVPLTDAIRNLARQSNLNFQFDPRVTQTNQPNVSIRFEKVTA